MSRLQARVLKAGAVTASISLGAAATFGVALWQGIDSWRTQANEKQQAESLAFKDLTERWSRLRVQGTSDAARASLAAELLRTGDLLCRQGGENFLSNFSLSVRILDDAKAVCAGEAADQRTPACVRLLDRDNGIDCLQPASAPACRPRYWARDYSGRTPPQENCSGFGADSTSFLAALVARADTRFQIRFREVPAPTPSEAQAPGAAASGATVAAAPATETAVDGAASDARAPSPAPRAAPSAPAQSYVQSTRGQGVCSGALVYMQVYGQAAREQARAFRQPWRSLGATVPPVEDVLESSRLAGRSPPAGHRQPTIVYHDAAQQPCADAMARVLAAPVERWTVRPLPSHIAAMPGTIEVWLPRANAYGATTPQRSGS